MRVRLKGLNSITKKLANGTRRTYWYAWKGGPPLRGEPGTPEFIHSYNEAIARKVAPPQGVLASLLRAYQGSGEFAGLAARTRADYISHCNKANTGSGLVADAVRRRSAHDPSSRAAASRSGAHHRGSAKANSVISGGPESPLPGLGV
jgi:hypothetical protein